MWTDAAAANSSLLSSVTSGANSSHDGMSEGGAPVDRCGSWAAPTTTTTLPASYMKHVPWYANVIVLLLVMRPAPSKYRSPDMSMCDGYTSTLTCTESPACKPLNTSGWDECMRVSRRPTESRWTRWMLLPSGTLVNVAPRPMHSWNGLLAATPSTLISNACRAPRSRSSDGHVPLAPSWKTYEHLG